MKESLSSRFNKIDNVKSTQIESSSVYSETKIKNNEEAPKQFISHTKKSIDKELPAYVSSRSRTGTGISHIFSDSFGMGKQNIVLDIEAITSKADQENSNLKKAVFKLSSFTSVDAVKQFLPPIVIYGAIDKINRVSSLKLRSAYYSDGMVYNWINRLVEYFLSAEPKIVGDNASDQKVIDKWVLANNFRELLKLQFQHKYNYGNAVWRWVKDANGLPNNIYFIDPLFFDAHRNEAGNVVYGDDGEPVSYVQYLKSLDNFEGLPKERIMYQSPQFSYQSGASLVFKKDEIIHLRLNRLGDDWWGIGQLESVYIDIVNKKNGEQGFAEALQSMGYPRIIGYSGDKEHPPTHQKMGDLFNAIDDLEADSKIVLPHYDEVKILESSKLDNVIGELEYLKDSVVTGLGGPKSLVTGSGEATNRSTLQDQKQWLERSLKMEQQDTSNEIKVKLLMPLAKKLKLKNTPKLIWQEVSMESLESKVERLVKLGKTGFINTEDPTIREFIRDLEDLPAPSTVPKKTVNKKTKKIVKKSKKSNPAIDGEVNDIKRV